MMRARPAAARYAPCNSVRHWSHRTIPAKATPQRIRRPSLARHTSPIAFVLPSRGLANRRQRTSLVKCAPTTVGENETPLRFSKTKSRRGPSI